MKPNVSRRGLPATVVTRTTATATATASAALARLIDRELPTVEILAVQGSDRGLRLSGILHLYEAETPGALGIPVDNHLRGRDSAVRGECCLQTGV